MSRYKIGVYILIFMFSFMNKTISNSNQTLFDFKINLINEDELVFSKFKGKTILLVNVASKCGFTKQYGDLQNLYNLYKNKGLIVIGIPSNQFGQQEPGSNEEIKNFCETNFNITFPMTEKVDVKGENANELYSWAKKNYGKSTIPKWNFHKILINKEGKVQDTYNSFIEPLSKKIIKEIELIL